MRFRDEVCARGKCQDSSALRAVVNDVVVGVARVDYAEDGADHVGFHGARPRAWIR